MKKLKRTSGIILSLIMMLQLIIPCVYAADNSVKIKAEAITSADTSLVVEVQSAITGGFMKVIEIPSGETYNSSNFFTYTALTDIVGYSSVKAGDNTISLVAAPTVGNQVIAVLRDTTSGSMVEYTSEPITVTESDNSKFISIKSTNITSTDTSLVVNVQKSITAGFMRILEIPSDEEYNSSNFFNYTSLATMGYASITAGNNTVSLDTSPTLGNKVIAVLRDTSTTPLNEYVSETVTVTEGGGSTSGNILDNCSAEIVMNGKTNFSVSDTSAVVNVKLDESLTNGVYMTVFAYPGNTAFDSDSIANKRLYAGFVHNGDSVTCDFSSSTLPLKAGYKIIACLNVPIGDDNYRSVVSQAYEVLDENGNGAPVYDWPHINIDEAALEAGATSLHMTLTGDERLFSNDAITIHYCLYQYPAVETFDLEGEYMIPLLSVKSATGAFTSEKFTFTEPLIEGYRVRAIVYWSQDIESFVPKGNDYEYAATDNSVLVSEASSVSVSFSADKALSSDTSVSVNVSGDVPSGSILLLHSFTDDTYTWLADGNLLVANKTNLTAGNNQSITVTNSDNLTAGRKLIALILSNGSIIAQSTPISITDEELVEPVCNIATSNVSVDTKELWLTTNFDNAIRSGYVTIYEYEGDTFDIDNNDNVILHGGAATASATSQKITINSYSLPLIEGRKIIAVLNLRKADETVFTRYYSEPVTVAGAAPMQAPTISINEKEITTGDLKAKLVTSFDSRAEVTYTLYSYSDGIENGTVLASKTCYSAGNETAYFKSGTTPLTAGNKIQAVITATYGSQTETAYSNIITVTEPPAWDTPTIAVHGEYITPDTTKVTVTSTYDEGYLSMDGYYCNITLYQIPIDKDTSDEFWEQSWAERIGTVQNSRGEVEINLTSALKAGYKLVAKLRLPHIEWEGEEVDYVSMPVYILNEGESIPKPIVLLYNLGTDTATGSKLAEVLENLNIEVKNITGDLLGEEVGYLAELDGFEASGEVYNGNSYDTQFMLMCNLGEALLDKVLAGMKENNVIVNHKAVLTQYNRYYKFYELIRDIQDEHKEFQAILALDKIIKEGEALNEADYTAEKWSAFSAVLISAQNTLSAETASYEDYLGAYCNLRKAIKGLSDITDYTDIQKNMSLVIGSTTTENAELMIGYYKSGVLLKLDSDTVNSDFTYALSDVEGADEIKVFLWNSINTMRPLCEAQSETIISASKDKSEYIKAVNSIVVDGVEVLSDSVTAANVINSDGSINLSNANVFANGENDAYLVTISADGYDTRTTLVGDTTLKNWQGSWENWQKFIFADDEYNQQYPYLERVWSLAYDGYIAAFEAAGMGDTMKKMYPNVNSLKTYWNNMTYTVTDENTVPIAEIRVDASADGYTLAWKNDAGEIIAKDTYTMTGKMKNGLEGATMYIFTADNLTGTFKYFVTMCPGMEGTEEMPVASHYHYQFGSSLDNLLNNGELYNGTDKNIKNKQWYATMINKDESALAKYNVILGMHRAAKWSEIPND